MPVFESEISMWNKIAYTILRQRLLMLLILGVITVAMGYFATKVEMQYEFGKLLPENDEASITYKNFRKTFGQDGLVIVIANTSPDFYTVEQYNKWHDLGEKIKKIKVKDRENHGDSLRAIDSVFSEASLYTIVKDKELKKFDLKPLVQKRPTTQSEVDQIKEEVHSLPFYEDIIYKKNNDLHLMMVFVNEGVFNSKNRGNLVQRIQHVSAEYEDVYGTLHYSGLPYVRSVTMHKVQSELFLFVFLALGITGFLLFFFFKSYRVVLVSMLVVAVGVIWSVGSIGLIGYKITILMGLIPPLIIVIGIPNCVYLITKYQQEYKDHGNKAKALTRVIRKVGTATFMTNATTALGFGTFVFTKSEMMQHFGVIAFIDIIAMFFLAILIVPILYSYMAPPKGKHTKHLDKKWLYLVVDKLVIWATRYRRLVYLVTLAILAFGGVGISLMRTSGNIVDDLPKHDKVVTDLKFFESELNGVMPFEILFTSKDTIYKSYQNIKKIDSIQQLLRNEPKLSRSISMIDGIKYITQAYANGNPEDYVLKSESSLLKLLKSKYFTNTFDLSKKKESSSFLSSFLDSTHHTTRVTFQVADIGTDSMAAVVERVSSEIEQVADAEKILVDTIKKLEGYPYQDTLMVKLFDNYPHIRFYVEQKLITGNDTLEFAFLENPDLIYSFTKEDGFTNILDSAVAKSELSFSITGSGVVYTKGTSYLVKNLFTSLILAIIVIAGLMAFLFKSWRMVIVSLIPNIIPLIVTAALMGFIGIPIKPSTILVFSIAFGISVDDTIHFLAKYRQELAGNNWDIRNAVIKAIRETGVSMIYTSIILFFGFSIFIASNFGGTQALGVLVSVTLFMAMLANLVLLPSLLLSLEKILTTKAFKDPLIETLDEEEDIELESLEIKD